MAPGAATSFANPTMRIRCPPGDRAVRDPPVYGAERYGSVRATSSAGSPRALIAITMYCLPSTM